jgi:hypothetical protein
MSSGCVLPYLLQALAGAAYRRLGVPKAQEVNVVNKLAVTLSMGLILPLSTVVMAGPSSASPVGPASPSSTLSAASVRTTPATYMPARRCHDRQGRVVRCRRR